MNFETKHFLASILASFGKKSKGNSVLMFHTISSREDIFSFEEEKFEKVLKTFKNIIHFEEVDKKEGIVITFDDGYRDNFTVAYPLLKKYNLPFTIFVVSDFIDKDDYMTKEELLEISRDPLVTIGAHGHTHNPLAKMKKDEAFNELAKSKNILEELIGKPVETMSFPHGSYDKEILTEAKRIGFKYIGTSDFGFFNKDADSINRIAIYKCDTPSTIRGKTLGKWNFLSSRL